MAFGDVWRLRDGPYKSTVVELCPWPRPEDWPPQVYDKCVTAIIIEGHVRYLDRVLGVGETGPMIAEESATLCRVGPQNVWEEQQ